MRRMKKLIVLMAILVSTNAMSKMGLYDSHGGYHGDLSANPYDANSVSNPYGRYGSKYSGESINNPYGRYGSRFSNDSPNNPYANGGGMVIIRH